jgi:hemerythrin-like domain-containing protein
MNNPVKVLIDEHDIIVTATELAKEADKILLNDEEAYDKVLRKLIVFFRLYADRYHHYKEERILFPEMSRKNELLQDGVIKEMFENHEDFRSMIQSIETFLDKKNYPKAQQQLHIYTEALLDHIAVENDEVFQMAETLFTPDELEKIYFRFEDCDHEIGAESGSGQEDKTNLIKLLGEIKEAFLPV